MSESVSECMCAQAEKDQLLSMQTDSSKKNDQHQESLRAIQALR